MKPAGFEASFDSGFKKVVNFFFLAGVVRNGTEIEFQQVSTLITPGFNPFSRAITLAELEKICLIIDITWLQLQVAHGGRQHQCWACHCCHFPTQCGQ
jgi:hypothetical protein